MTGLDCLREEMKKRGLPKVQIESKTAAVVLDIVANAGNKYEEIQKQETDATKRLKEIEESIREHEMEIEKWRKKARRIYSRDVGIIQKCIDKPSKRKRRKAWYAVSKLTSGKIEAFVRPKVRAYNKEELREHIRDSADRFFGDPDITIEKLVEAYPPDDSNSDVLKNEEEKAKAYIRKEYARIVQKHKSELEEMTRKLQEAAGEEKKRRGS